MGLSKRSSTCSLIGFTTLKMKTMILGSLLAAAAIAAPEGRFSCSECVDEMHKLGWMVKMGAVPIHDYIAANYCPTLGDQQGWCEEKVSRYYVGMLFAIVEHYFVDGAIHVCQTGGACDAVKEYTCDECIQGLEWVEAYIEDPIMVAEYVVYLEQNYCISGGRALRQHAHDGHGEVLHPNRDLYERASVWSHQASPILNFNRKSLNFENS